MSATLHHRLAVLVDVSQTRVLKMLVSATVSYDPAAFSDLNLHCPRLLAPRQDVSKYSLPQGNRRWTPQWWNADFEICSQFWSQPNNVNLSMFWCTDQYSYLVFNVGLKEFKVVCPAPLRPLILVKLLMDMKKEKTLVFAQTVETAHRYWFIPCICPSGEPDCTVSRCVFISNWRILTWVFTASNFLHHRVFLLLNEMESLKGNVAEFSAQLSAKEKKKSLGKFRKNQIVLVASDAMSRGMDVHGIDVVINYDTPTRAKTYIHR